MLKGRRPPAQGPIIAVIDFEKNELENLELLKRHFGQNENQDAIKALIAEKCGAIRLAEEQEHNRLIQEAKDNKLLGKYTPPQMC